MGTTTTKLKLSAVDWGISAIDVHLNVSFPIELNVGFPTAAMQPAHNHKTKSQPLSVIPQSLAGMKCLTLYRSLLVIARGINNMIVHWIRVQLLPGEIYRVIRPYWFDSDPQN